MSTIARRFSSSYAFTSTTIPSFSHSLYTLSAVVSCDLHCHRRIGDQSHCSHYYRVHHWLFHSEYHTLDRNNHGSLWHAVSPLASWPIPDSFNTGCGLLPAPQAVVASTVLVAYWISCGLLPDYLLVVHSTPGKPIQAENTPLRCCDTLKQVVTSGDCCYFCTDTSCRHETSFLLDSASPISSPFSSTRSFTTFTEVWDAVVWAAVCTIEPFQARYRLLLNHFEAT